MSMFLTKNRRRNFRVSLINPIPGYLEIQYSEGNLNKFLLISILDISTGGVKIKSPYFLPFNKEGLFRVYFKFNQEEFGSKGRLVWHKVEKGELLYGIEFLEKTQSVERKLTECLKNYREKMLRKVEVEQPKSVCPR